MQDFDTFQVDFDQVVSIPSTGIEIKLQMSVEDVDTGANDAQAVVRYVNVAITKTGTTSINDFELNNTSVIAYPNPVTNSFNLNSSINIESVNLYNITGRLLKTFNAKDKYDISDLATGVYIAKIKTEFGTKTLRVVKE